MQKKKTDKRNDLARPGFQRWTSHVRLENIKAIKVFAAKNKLYVMDIIDGLINDWRKKTGN